MGTYDGNHVMVPNPNEMISTVAPIIKANMWVLKPQGADERLDPRRGEVQRQVRLPQSFMLINTIPNPIEASTLAGMSKKMFSYIPRSKAPTSLMGGGLKQCVRPHFFTKTLAISGIQLTSCFTWWPHYVKMVEHQR
jgi:hypothetical protein